ncbi:MAG: type II secretion system protein [Candidatus Gracilibacteria bacterium]|nr:type II secretion system protein [Candidatus Gracilibacteria bacterium]
MIKNTKKAFTLVELIVVITILAILATIAFISLQGYSQDAKNSKVASDLRNIASAIETNSTKNSTPLSSVLTNSGTTNRLAGTESVGSGILLSDTTYRVGNVNFATIGQNGADFTDPNNGDSQYVFAMTTSSGFKGYQVAGRVIENDTNKARITGSYYKKATTDALGLIAGTNPVTGSGLVDGDTNDLY